MSRLPHTLASTLIDQNMVLSGISSAIIFLHRIGIVIDYYSTFSSFSLCKSRSASESPAADVLADFIRCNIIIWCLQPVLVSQPLHVKHISVFHQPFYQQMILWVIWFFLVVFCTFHSWSAAPQSIVSVFVHRFMQKESTALQIRRPSFFSFTINQ